ncbi:MAG: hypothetical protein KC492_01185, partial [Myxococcales bacterium]|nr:hypothetical protein [Myxococcales bacterium]
VGFCAYDFQGRPIRAKQTGVVSELLAPIFRRQTGSDARETYQVQVLIERLDSVSEHDRVVGRRLLSEARGRCVLAASSLANAQPPLKEDESTR